MKRLGLIIVCIVTIVFVVSIGCGCRLPIKAVPGPGRNGRLYCYTEDYSDRYFPFCLYGKSLIASKGDGSWEIIPSPTAIFPGIPLFFLEKYIICPVIDTVMIPYDFYLKIQNAKVCENDGVFIKVVDVSGKPVQGVDVKISIGAKNGYRIVYGGKACHKWMYQEVIKSDVHGEVYVPVDIETCSEIRFSGQWKTTNGCDLFDGKIDCQYFNENISYWIRNGGDEARILFWGDRYLPGEYLKISMRCPRCLSRGIVRELDDKWRLTGECVKCGKKLWKTEVILRQKFLMKSIESSKRMYPPLSVKDFHYISKQSGIPLTVLESIYGKCPIDDEKHRVLIRLKGKIGD